MRLSCTRIWSPCVNTVNLPLLHFVFIHSIMAESTYIPVSQIPSITGSTHIPTGLAMSSYMYDISYCCVQCCQLLVSSYSPFIVKNKEPCQLQSACFSTVGILANSEASILPLYCSVYIYTPADIVLFRANGRPFFQCEGEGSCLSCSASHD